MKKQTKSKITTERVFLTPELAAQENFPAIK